MKFISFVLTVIESETVERVSNWSLVQEGDTVVASKMLTTIFRLLTKCEVRLVLDAAAMDAMLSTRDIVVWQLYLVFRDLPAGSLKRKYFITHNVFY